MIFVETELSGAFLVDLERREDERGFFARGWCRRELEDRGLCGEFVQCNMSFNHQSGTLRGMHYQVEPSEEVKLIRCIRGAVFDAIVDLRSDSPTYKRWIGVELTADNRRALYVPEGFAHGYQTLVDGTETMYQVSRFYSPADERGVRWDDPAFGIEWPGAITRIISDKDKSWPNFAT